MTFVPVHVPHSLPSARARDLADRLARVITDYRSEAPDLEAHEVQQALQLAAMEAQPGGAGSGLRVIALALVAVLALLIGQVLIAGGAVDSPLTVALGATVVLLVFAGLVVHLRGR